jgi:hypothetical protein
MLQLAQAGVTPTTADVDATGSVERVGHLT